MLDKLQYAMARKYIVNELAYIAQKYDRLTKEGMLPSKMAAKQKLECVIELADRFQIDKKEIGL